MLIMMTAWKGYLIEESLDSKDVLSLVNILSTKVEELSDVAEGQPNIWHTHKIEVSNDIVDEFQKTAENCLKEKWYMDISSDDEAIVIFKGKSFRAKKNDREAIDKIKEYGKSLGIPEKQLDFDKFW